LQQFVGDLAEIFLGDGYRNIRQVQRQRRPALRKLTFWGSAAAISSFA